MSEENPKPPNDNRQRPAGGEPPMNWRGLLLLALALALFGGFFLVRGNNLAQAELIPYPKFLQLVNAGKLVVTAEQPLELVVEESQKSERRDANSVEWTVIVPANGSTDVTATFDSKY